MTTRPPALVAVAGSVVVEAALLIGVAAVYLAGVLRLGTADPLFAALTAAGALAVAVGLLACARGLLRGHRWARAPVITWQLLQGAAVVPALGTPLGPAAAVLLALGVVVVVGLFLPPVQRATSGTQAPPVT